MPFVTEDEAPAEAPKKEERKAAPARTRSRTKSADPAEGTEAPSGRTRGGGIQRRANGQRPAPDTSTPPDDDLSWAHTGEDAERIEREEEAKVAQRKAERDAEGYWPNRFRLRETPGENQADAIILDAAPGPCYYEHVMKNPRTGFWNVIETCPKETENCPICPPNGEKDSVYTMLITILNLNGYTKADGTFIPVTKEVVPIRQGDMATIRGFANEEGGLRGVQVLFTRDQRYGPNYGRIEFIGRVSDEDIEHMIKENGMWKQKETRDGEVIDADPAHMTKPYAYGKFLKRPDAAKLRRKYGSAGGGGQTFGSRPSSRSGMSGAQDRRHTNLDDHEADEWGGGQFDPSDDPPFETGSSDVDKDLGWDKTKDDGV